MAKESKLSRWWQKRTGEEETPFDSDSSAFFTSVIIHVFILIGLGLWPFVSGNKTRDILLTTTAVEIDEITEPEPPEQIHFSEQQMAEVGANSERAEEMAFSEAPIISDVSEIPNPDDPSNLEVAELLLNNQVVEATGIHFNENLTVRGAVGEGTTGATGAVDRITHEILLSLEERRTLVIWMFDQSGSLARQREQIHDRFDKIYEELGILEAAENEAFSGHAQKPLLTQVMAFGKTVSQMMKEPSDNVDEIKAAVRAISQDDSGIELTFEAIYKTVNAHSKYRAVDADGEPKRNVMVVVVSDEAGEDQQHVDMAVKICQKYAVPVYVVGVPAPFGRQETLVKWVDPDPTYDQTAQWGRVNQGPESAMPERIKLHFAGAREDKDPIDSGFGPWALTRLCYESGGIYFAVHPNRNVNRAISSKEVANFSSHLKHFFDPSVMRDYRPDYVPYREYERRIKESAMRTALIQAAQQSWSTPMQNPRLRFVKRDEATFSSELSESQKMAAQLEPQIAGIYQLLQLGEGDRDKEKSLRWKVGYDLAVGRVLATKVRTETYNAMLAAAKRGLKQENEKSNTWTLVPANEITVGSQYSKAGEQARQLLESVVEQHPGTPWALLAKRELSNPIGWRWQESYTDLTPPRQGNGGNGNNNPAAANDAANMIKKPPPKRRPPKL
ncbi:MAG: vWA domain-containing protein [Planctomycetota bacterium]|nr:vWA domain-containing protein [Planctomycetota bacterium]